MYHQSVCWLLIPSCVAIQNMHCHLHVETWVTVASCLLLLDITHVPLLVFVFWLGSSACKV